MDKLRELFESFTTATGFTTGLANHIVRNGLLEEGINFVQKPYALKTLALAIRNVLDD